MSVEREILDIKYWVVGRATIVSTHNDGNIHIIKLIEILDEMVDKIKEVLE